MPKLDITEQEASFSKLQRGFHAVVAYSLPSSQTSALLAKEITAKAIIILGIEGGATGQSGTTDEHGAVNDSMDVDQLYSTSYREWRKDALSGSTDYLRFPIRSMLPVPGNPIVFSSCRTR